MRRSSSWLLRGGLAVISLLALPACVEGTTSSTTATSPSDAAGMPTTAPTPPPVVAPPTTPTPPVASTPPVVAAPPVASTPTSTAPPATALPSTAPPVVLLTLDGTWESASCGGRTYPRRITFAEAARFTAEDLVSPCPKGTTCVWAGIINRQGTYRLDKDTVILAVTKTGSGPAKTQFPASLALDASHAPVETGSDGKACVYKHVGRGDQKP
jgi:hypothetical protein